MDTSAEKEVIKNGIVLERDKLPMTLIYKGKRYILILTKNDKLILNKYEE